MDLKLNTGSKSVKELVSTPKGKGIAAGLILVVLVLIVLAIASFALPKAQDPSDLLVKPVAKPKLAPSAPVVKTAASATDTAVADTETVEMSTDFTEYRDPFSPLIETTTSVGPPGSPASDGAVYASDRLRLLSIEDQGGVKVAMVSYQGVDYPVRAGMPIADSAYLVTEVADTSMSVLYGDDRLTLQLGEEIVK